VAAIVRGSKQCRQGNRTFLTRFDLVLQAAEGFFCCPRVRQCATRRPLFPAMLGYDGIIVLLLIGVLAVLVPFVGGLRGLFTPDVTPFFLRKRKQQAEEEGKPSDSSRNDSKPSSEPDKRKAA
jgi:hypothetical protein